MNRKPYPSDLTKAQWKLVARLLPPVKPGGRPRKYDLREVVNALLYVNREGCSWRAVPHDLRAEQFARLSVIWADSKYRNDTLDEWLRGQDRLRVEVTSKPGGQKGFKPLPKRWVVEQTFAGLIRSRRLVRDFERLPATSGAMVKVSSIHRMARRARPARGRRKFRHEPKTAA